MRLSLFLLVCCLLGGCAGFDPHGIISRHIGNTAPTGAQLDAQQRSAAFDFVWNTINTNYVDPAFNGVDWHAVGKRYRPEVLGAPDDLSFWMRLNKMTGELHDTHTGVESPQRYREQREHQGVSLSVLVQEYDGQLFIERVGETSEAWLAGLRPGDHLTQIDDQPAMDWWQHVKDLARNGSTQRSRQLYANIIFNTGRVGDSVKVAFDRPDGTHVTTRIARNLVSSKPGVMVLRLASGLGYLRFSSFDESIRRKTLQALDSLADTKGIILDLRNNGGGSIFFAQALASQFVKGRHDIARVVTRTGKPVTLLFGMIDVLKPEFVLDGVETPLKQPLVILTNSATASASELTAAALQGMARARVIGDTSCGCLAGFLGYANVPGGGALSYTELRLAFKDGRQVEGVGLVPDELVRQTVADLVKGRDSQFEAAVAWLVESGRPVQ
jgi:carboxyl-terminal processing protease